jgi:hydrogenase maturation protease
MWAVLRSLLTGVGLLVALVAFAAFVAAVVSVWQVKAETNRRTDELAARAHGAVDAADRGVKFVDEVLTKAEADLKEAKNHPAAPKEPANPFLQLTARKATENLVGSVDRANVAVVTASEAAAVAQAALDIFGSDEQMKSWLGVQPEQLAQTRSSLDTARGELSKVRTILGVPLGDGPTHEQLVTVESALAQAREFVEQIRKLVATTRTRVDETKRGIDLWAMRIAVGVTALGVAGAVGQLFLARFCWRVLRGKPA